MPVGQKKEIIDATCVMERSAPVPALLCLAAGKSFNH